MNRSQLVFGLVFVVVGVLLLAEQADVLSAWAIISDWWPTAVILAGLAQLSLRPRNPIGAAITLAVGFALLLFSLGVIDTLAVLWPVLLIALGAWLLLARPAARAGGDGPIIDVVALFDDRTRTLPPGDFPGGSITTVFGDVSLDLGATTLRNGRGTLQVTTVFGNVDVTIPTGWTVKVNGPEIFGSVRSPSPHVGTADPSSAVGELQLRTVLVFGDVTLRTAGTRNASGAAYLHQPPP